MRLRLVAAATALALSGCAPTGSTTPTGDSSASQPTASSPSAAPPSARRVLTLLDRVEVAEASYRPGYDRSCDPGACVFGPLWTDRHRGAFGRNGCTTREDVLVTQLRDLELRWGSRCRPYDGWLVDPYSGERLTWRDDGYWIQVDHVYPLARAWHAGAWAWPQSRRVAFANDVRRGLLAVSTHTNQDKRAQGPGEWLPPWPDGRCDYVLRYLRVADHWGLPITPADARGIRQVARSDC